MTNAKRFSREYHRAIKDEVTRSQEEEKKPCVYNKRHMSPQDRAKYKRYIAEVDARLASLIRSERGTK
jgi:hypothetical protein